MLITDRQMCPIERLPALVSEVVAVGVDAVQLREKGLPDADLHALAATLRDVIAGRAVLFVNGRAAVAVGARADGVQLGEGAHTVADVRRLIGAGMLIGRSVHDRAGSVAAERDGADLLVLGTVYPSRSHPGGPTGGVALVADVTAAVRLPVIAVGGITPDNAAAVIRAGARGVAVISAILAARSPAVAAATLRQVVDQSMERGRCDDPHHS